MIVVLSGSSTRTKNNNVCLHMISYIVWCASMYNKYHQMLEKQFENNTGSMKQNQTQKPHLLPIFVDFTCQSSLGTYIQTPWQRRCLGSSAAQSAKRRAVREGAKASRWGMPGGVTKFNIFLVRRDDTHTHIHITWLMVWTPLKNISQLGWLFLKNGKCSKPPTSNLSKA